MKGLALGASLVGLGRPILYALAAEGTKGVTELIRELDGELKRIMSMTGTPNCASISRNILIDNGPFTDLPA